MEHAFERIVRLIPVDELCESYNSVLHDEILSVKNAFDKVATAFARLGEVHEAANKLQRQESTLTDTMHDTLKLHRELQTKLQQFMQNMGARQRSRKRKRIVHTINSNIYEESESLTSSSESDSSTTESVKEKWTPIRKKRSRDVSSRSSGGLFNDSRVILDLKDDNGRIRRLNLLAPVNSSEKRVDSNENNCGDGEEKQVETINQQMQMTTIVDKIPMQEQSIYYQQVLTNLLEEGDAVVIAKFLDMWAKESTDRATFLDVHSNFRKAMAVYADQVVDAKANTRLNRLNMKVTRMLNTLDSRNDNGAKSIKEKAVHNEGSSKSNNCHAHEKNPPQSSTTSTDVGVSENTGQFKRLPTGDCKTMMENLNQLPLHQKVQCIPQVLCQLQEVMVNDSGKQSGHIIHAVRQIKEWIEVDGDAKQEISMYRDFADSLISYSIQRPGQDILQRVSINFSEVIEKLQQRSSCTVAAKSLDATRDGSVQSKRTSGSSIEILGPGDDSQSCLVGLVHEMTTMSAGIRRQRLPTLILDLKKALSTDIDGRFSDTVRRVVETVGNWVLNWPSEQNHVRMYAATFKVVSAYTTRLQFNERIVELERQLIRVSGQMVTAYFEDFHGKRTDDLKLTLHDKDSDGRCEDTLPKAINTDENSAKLQPEVELEPGLDYRYQDEKIVSQSEDESTSESESDYEDEKEAIGGSEAAWNVVLAAGAHGSRF